MTWIWTSKTETDSHASTRTHAGTCTHTHTGTCTHTHTHSHTDACTHTHTHPHKHIHTYTPTNSLEVVEQALNQHGWLLPVDVVLLVLHTVSAMSIIKTTTCRTLLPLNHFQETCGHTRCHLSPFQTWTCAPKLNQSTEFQWTFLTLLFKLLPFQTQGATHKKYPSILRKQYS